MNHSIANHRGGARLPPSLRLTRSILESADAQREADETRAAIAYDLALPKKKAEQQPRQAQSNQSNQSNPVQPINPVKPETNPSTPACPIIIKRGDDQAIRPKTIEILSDVASAPACRRHIGASNSRPARVSQARSNQKRTQYTLPCNVSPDQFQDAPLTIHNSRLMLPLGKAASSL